MTHRPPGRPAWAVARAMRRPGGNPRLTFAQLQVDRLPLRDRSGPTPADQVRELAAQAGLRQALGRRTLPW